MRQANRERGYGREEEEEEEEEEKRKAEMENNDNADAARRWMRGTWRRRGKRGRIDGTNARKRN